MKNFNNMIFDSYKDTYLWRLTIFSLEKFTLVFSLNKLNKKYCNIIKKYTLQINKVEFYSMSNTPSLGEWERFINKIIIDIKNHGIKYFLTYRPIISTMNLTNVQFLKYEYIYLKNSSNWGKIWGKLLKKSNKLPEYRFLKNIYYTGNFIHHGYLLEKYLEFSNIDFKSIDSVYEFGGGYGALGTILRRLGFSKNYYIYDFTIFNILQGFFLEIEGNKIISNPNEKYGFYLYNDINSTTKINNTGINNLFVATWSLSESPLNVRKKYLEFLNNNSTNFNYFLIGFQKEFGEVNNFNYFEEFKKKFKNIEWKQVQIDYLPNNYLLFGKRK